MKKCLLFLMGAMMSMASLAQEEVDMTYLIKNAGFDEDLTWQADGSKKEIVDQSTVLSNRSIAGVAADGSLYALVNPSTPNKRKAEPERTLEATNGFKAVIDGWTCDLPAGKGCEWTYFGSVPYTLGDRAVPVADDGDSYLTVPQKPADYAGEDNIGMLYLRAGWGNEFAYRQEVTLPCAVYRLEYWTININQNSSATATDLTQVSFTDTETGQKMVFKDETGSGLSATEWTKHEFSFTPTARFVLQFGFKSANAGSGANPIVCIDGIKLYKTDDADPDQVILAMSNLCQELAAEAQAAGYNGLASQIAEYSFEIEDIDPSESVEQFTEDIKAVDQQIEYFRDALAEMEAVDAILVKMDKLLQSTNYAGKAAFENDYEKILGYKEKSESGVDYATLILGAVAEANAAIRTYYLSQTDTASEANPADFTFFIQHPWFINADAEPTFEDGMWVFPKRYDEEGTDLYKAGSASSPDLNSEGWEITGTYTAGSEQRLNWQRERSCWNAWGSPITGTIAVGQTIEGLPNGYYTVTADLICQPEYVSDQHVYAQSTAEKKISADNLAMHEVDYDNNAWVTVSMSATEKVLVVDGKLTIGAEGTGNGSNQTGWFLATNFKLNFLGKASDDEIAAAIKTSFDNSIATAKEFANGMHFAADKKTLNDTIAKYEGADKDAYLVAIAAIDAAKALAQTSENKYFEYLPAETPDDISGKTLLWVKALIDGQAVEGKTAFSEGVKPIAQFAYEYVMGWIASDSATYTKMDATCDLLKNYVNTYIPAYQAAEQVAAAATEKGKNYLTNLMASQKEQLVAVMQTKTAVDEFVTELTLASDAVEKQNIYEAGGNDYTAYIQNPNAEAEEGWEFERGNGDKNTTSGQWFDGSSTRYFDSYHSQDVTDPESGEVTSHIGLENFRFGQLVKGLPNGTYTVGVYTRTPAEGAYVFSQVAPADTAFVEIPLQYYNDEIASDKYGKIWEEAMAAYVAGSTDEQVIAIAEANASEGRGWQHQTFEVNVTNHELLIGSMTGTSLSKAGKVFAGNWYSVGGWTLTLVSLGDNTGFTGPLDEFITGIESVTAGNAAVEGVYTLSGVKVAKMQRGLNIVVRNGKTMKVLVK